MVGIFIIVMQYIAQHSSEGPGALVLHTIWPQCLARAASGLGPRPDTHTHRLNMMKHHWLAANKAIGWLRMVLAVSIICQRQKDSCELKL